VHFIANLEDHLDEQKQKVMDVPSKAMTGYSASSPDEVGKMKLRSLFPTMLKTLLEIA